MERYEKPIVVKMRNDITTVAPAYPVVGAVGFLAGLMGGDSHSVNERKIKYLEVNQKNNGIR